MTNPEPWLRVGFEKEKRQETCLDGLCCAALANPILRDLAVTPDGRFLVSGDPWGYLG